MAELFAVRNLRLCTKDCLCLYVCPTGAADTENSIIDTEKCLGCGRCAAACPSGAISMVPREMPPQQPKVPPVKDGLRALIQSKAEAESLAAQLPGPLAAALEKSCRLMAEDLCREGGYMLPQSGNTRAFLEGLLGDPSVPQAPVEFLLTTLGFNEPAPEAEPPAPKPKPAPKPEPERWRCTVCGYIHEGPLPPDFVCPRCHQPASVFERIK